MIKKCTQIFIDGTFKISPTGYYQVIIIGGFLPELSGIIPIFFIPTTGKSQYLYENIFEDIKKILEDNKINYKNLTKQYMLDFEPSLQNAVRKVFEGIKISGCYFHYVKILWQKAKKYGLCTKSEIRVTKILLFILKIIPYLEIDERTEIFKKIEDFYKSNGKYEKLLKYYKKVWINNSYLNYAELTEDEYLNRTNNYLEYFHHILNSNIEVFHPKLSFLIEKYKSLILSLYNKIKDSIINDIGTKKEKFSIINDIYEYLNNYNKKYSSKINIHNIIQSEKDELKIINKISNYLVELFFNLDIEENYINNSGEEINNENENNLEDFFKIQYEKENNFIDDFEVSIENKENDDLKEDEMNDLDEFFPQKKFKSKTKRNYNELIGEKNELKLFQDNLILNRNHPSQKK